MKKQLVTLIGALTLGATLPAFAGPDFPAIERARRAKQAMQVERHGDAYEAAGPTAAGTCPTEALVLPLDHGLRALTTPQQNRLRMERYEAKLKACKNAAK